MQPQTYQVQKGDTRSSIAKRLGVSVDKIGLGKSGNPDLISPGETLAVGGGTQPQVNVAQMPSQPQAQVVPANLGLGTKQQPLNIPNPTPTQAQGLMGTIEGTQNSFANILSEKAQAQRVAQEKGNVATTQQQLADAFAAFQNRGQRVSEIQNEYKLPAAMQEAADIKSQIDAKALSYRRQKEAIMQRGGSKEAVNNEINALDRRGASELADLAIVQQAKLGNLQVAQQLAQQKIDLEMEDAKLKLDYTRQFYNDAKDSLSKAEDRQFQLALKDQERKYDLEKERRQFAMQLKLHALKNGASQEEANLLGENGDPIEIVRNAVSKVKGKKGSQTLENILGVLVSTRDMAKNNSEGVFKGISPILRKPGFAQSAEGRMNRQYLEAINLKVQQWASGASLTSEQTKQVKRLTPDKNDTDSQVRDKLNGLTSFFLSQAESSLANQGVPLTIPNINYFDSSSQSQDPLEINVDNYSITPEEDTLNLFN